MRLASLLAVPCLLLAPASAFAADPAPAASPSPKPKLVCRRDVATGSIMPRRTCHTSEEWQAIDERNAAATERFTNQRPANNNSLGN